MERLFAGVAALSGAAAVIADAAARHLLAGDEARVELAATAARYGLVHAAALLALAALLRDAPPGPPRAWLAASGWCFAAALLLFCGGLYLRAAGAGPAVTPLVPAGGTLFIAGWAALLVAALWPRPPG
ncbi:MAG TPA: DUF423 domain-containing protein [Stellaceae bacterium]|nr:DUF423 domain-containing protein [Stellaceae bacterium]